MAGFTLPVGANTEWQGNVAYGLPDDLDATGVRFTIQLMHFKGKNNQTFQVLAPAAGTVHMLKPIKGLESIAIFPFPFAIRTEVAGLPGVPVFYLAADAWTPGLKEDDAVDAGTPLAYAATKAYFGVMFQDRVSLVPERWLAMLDNASGGAAWQALMPQNAPAGAATIRILDHTGRLFKLPPAAFESSGGPPPAAGADGELILGGGAKQFRWKGDPRAGDEALPVISLYETGTSAAPGEWLELPPGGLFHAQVLELSRWFAKPLPGVNTSRFHKGCRVEPIVDGLPTYRRLIEDLLACAHPGHGAELAGWVFEDILLDPERPETKFSTLVQKVCQDGGDARLLVNQYLMLKATYGKANVNRMALSPALMSLGLAPAIAAFLNLIKPMGVESDLRGIICLTAATHLAAIVLASLMTTDTVTVEDILKKAFEESKDVVDKLEANTPEGSPPRFALWDPYPARFADNPLATNLPWLADFILGPAGLAEAIDQVGNWHQKFQIVKRLNGGGSEYVAYTGGIDIYHNRLDCPGHQVWDPFHDVQARVLGPAVVDFCRAWSERYQRLPAPKPAEVFAPPDVAALTTDPAKHLVQVGRTSYKPAGTKDSGGPLPFAPQGDSTINDTLIQAVKAAREYIYIEDQYFTPNKFESPAPDLTDEAAVKTLLDALLAAHSHCRRLLIVVPEETDQTFGDVRRRYLFQELQKVWGDRVKVGTIRRRPVLSIAKLSASEGRCVLAQPVAQNISTVFLSPPARVPPNGPFWFWIDGELMRSVPDGISDAFTKPPSLRVTLEQPCARPHKQGAAVTVSQPKGIYVHAKVMIVDDVFVSIGSANLNRRGLYHDGEIAVFTIPEGLKAAADNPARTLRSALWAEHLGLPPAMGVLLADPLAAFDLFCEDRGPGARFAALDASKMSIGFPPTSDLLKMLFKLAVGTWETAEERSLWNVVIDPTGLADPGHESGPLPLSD